MSPDSTSYARGSPGVGFVGLYKLCEFVSFGNQRICDGKFQEFSTILTDAFRASTFFIGVSCLVIFLCILLFLLFFCIYEVYVYLICGSLQVVSGELFECLKFLTMLFVDCGSLLSTYGCSLEFHFIKQRRI